MINAVDEATHGRDDVVVFGDAEEVVLLLLVGLSGCGVMVVMVVVMVKSIRGGEGGRMLEVGDDRIDH